MTNPGTVETSGEINKTDPMDDSTQLQSEGSGQSSSRFRWLATALIVLFLTAAAGAYTRYSLRSSCDVGAVQQASVFLTTQLNMYDRVYQVAISASRTAPDHPVNTLKQIVMDTQELSVPVCVQTAKNELVNYMGTVILAFQAYRAGEADATVEDLIQRSETQYVNFRSEMTAVKECAPYCIPSLRELRAYDWIP